MRTTTLSTLLASMLAIGCVPMGSNDEQRSRVDAGGSGSSGSDTDTSCDTTNITVKSGDLDFTSDGSNSVPSSCWQLAGKLTIDSSVTSLAKLGDLRSVTDLVITDSGLTTINTPNPLAVTGSVDIESNTKLNDLSNLSLPAGTTGAGSAATCSSYLTAVTIKGNTALASLGGMNQLGCVIGVTDIEANTKLTTIDLSSAIRLEGGLTITGNTEATTLQLGSLMSVGGMTISGNTSLTSLGSWSSLQFMHGPLTIDGNTALTTLAGVMNGTAGADNVNGTGIMIEGELSITNNTALTDTAEFKYLSWAEQINIQGNTQLDYCTAREIGCCVVDSSPSNENMAAINQNKNTTCGGASSWCFNPNDDKCHNDYTGYNTGYGIK